MQVLPGNFWASGVSNDVLVTGYVAGRTTWHFWDPDLGTTEDIGGASPDNFGAGQTEFSTDGQRVCGTAAGAQGMEMATYDRTTGTWTTRGGLDEEIDGNTSNAWDISGDGGTVVGMGWVGSTAHGMVWTTNEGIIDLGSPYLDASTRAIAVSNDGGVVVGCQDVNGPWKSAVWCKNAGGEYDPNTFLLIDPTSATDEYNQAGECSAVSAEGTRIGGYGADANNDEPWIWSEATGVLSLGTLPDIGRGCVTAFNTDGSTEVGWIDGPFFGYPRKAFIGTQADGLKDLNTYATNERGVDLGSQQLYSISDISPDGHYISGTGVNSSAFAMFGFRLELGTTTGIHAGVAAEPLEIWPNPASDLLQFCSDVPSELVVTVMDGSEVVRKFVFGDVRLDVSDLGPGIYAMAFRTAATLHTQRFV